MDARRKMNAPRILPFDGRFGHFCDSGVACGVVLSLVLMLCSRPARAQILTNGGFESGFSGWTDALSNGGVATFSNQNSIIQDGTNALRVVVSNPGTATNSVSMVSTPFNASSNDIYVLRFWANTDTLDAGMGVNLIGASPGFPQITFLLSTNSLAAGDEHFQEYLYAFKASGTISVAFNFQTAAEYWLDDVEIMDLTNNDGYDIAMTYLWQWGQWHFAQTNRLGIGWTGGDNDKSALLPDGSVAWIFNDSYASTLNSFYSNIRGDSSLPRNSLLHQVGTNLVWLNNGDNSFFIPTNLNDNLMPAAPNGLYWIAGSIAETNKLYVLLNGLNNSPLSNICMAVATLSLPGMSLDGVVTNLTSTGTDNFGDLVRGDDGCYYIYNGPNVARVPFGQLAVNSAWTYWNGTGWVTDHTQNVAISDFSGWSIAKLGTSNYVAVYKPVLSLDIYAQFAPSPMGPWGYDQVIFSVPDQGGEGIFSAYAPKICAGTGQGGIYTIGYSDNGCTESWFAKTYSDKSWYNPHFFKANLLALSPYSVNYTNGGPGSRMSIKFAADQDYNYDYINNSYGAGVLNTTNWFNLGIGGGGSGVTNVPYYSYNGQKYASGAQIVYNWIAEKTHTVDSQSKSNNVAMLESWINVNDNCWYLSVTNLDPVFTNGYSVYFYFHGSAAGYGGQNYLRFYSGATTGSGVLGTRQWNLYTTDASNNGTFVQDSTPANAGTSGETPGANYLIFTNLSGGAFDLLITNGNYGGVNAIEVVANTLPAVGGPMVSPATNVYAGNTVALACTASGGVAPFGVSWQACADGISWTNIAGASSTNLVLTNFAPANAGYYQMVYTAGALSATSSVVFLSCYATLPGIGTIAVSPGNTVNQGTSFNLSCTTNGGAPPFVLQWQASSNGLNYTNLAGANALSLSVLDTGPGSYGDYQCVFTAAGVSVTSAPVQLTVQPLSISPAVVLPSNPVFYGQAAVLMCTNYAGLGNYSFQWQASANAVAWTNVPGALTNQLVLLGVTSNNAAFYQCVFGAANGSVTSAPVRLGVLPRSGAVPHLAIKFAPDQNYNHCFINLNWTTSATKQPAGVLNTTNWNNWNTASQSSPYTGGQFFYDVNGSTNGNLSSAAIMDFHSGEQVVYYNGAWPASWFTNNNALLLNSTFWYFNDQIACQVTNLDPVFATNGYSLYVYYLGTGIGQGQQVCLANYSGMTTNNPIVNSQICSLYTTTNWNNFNNGAYLTNLPSYLKGSALLTQGVSSTSTAHGSYPLWENAGADYVVFSNCPPSGAFSLAVSNTFYAGICGIELAATLPGGGLLPTASALGASTNVLYPGTSVTFTNIVSPVPPNGEFVIFLDGTNLLGLGALSGGIATCRATGWSAGSHSIQAVYGGDGSFLASTSGVASVMAVANPALGMPVALPCTNLYAGMNVTLVCSNYSGMPPFAFQWQVSTNGSAYLNLNGAVTNQVLLPGVSPMNSGFYRLDFTAAGLSTTSSVLQLVVNPPATLNLQPAVNGLILSWPQGALLQSTNVGGPWSTNGANSPYTNAPSQTQMFYRIQLQ